MPVIANHPKLDRMELSQHLHVLVSTHRYGPLPRSSLAALYPAVPIARFERGRFLVAVPTRAAPLLVLGWHGREVMGLDPTHKPTPAAAEHAYARRLAHIWLAQQGWQATDPTALDRQDHLPAERHYIKVGNGERPFEELAVLARSCDPPSGTIAAALDRLSPADDLLVLASNPHRYRRLIIRERRVRVASWASVLPALPRQVGRSARRMLLGRSSQ